jgi:hypothetical protein
MPADRPASERANRAPIGTGLLLALAVGGLLLIAADLVIERHPHFPAERWTGFYALCGAVATSAGIALAWPLRRIATRPEVKHDR